MIVAAPPSFSFYVGPTTSPTPHDPLVTGYSLGAPAWDQESYATMTIPQATPCPRGSFSWVFFGCDRTPPSWTALLRETDRPGAVLRVPFLSSETEAIGYEMDVPVSAGAVETDLSVEATISSDGNGRYWIRDGGWDGSYGVLWQVSRYGIIVNGVRVFPGTVAELRPGDTLILGGEEFWWDVLRATGAGEPQARVGHDYEPAVAQSRVLHEQLFFEGPPLDGLRLFSFDAVLDAYTGALSSEGTSVTRVWDLRKDPVIRDFLLFAVEEFWKSMGLDSQRVLNERNPNFSRSLSRAMMFFHRLCEEKFPRPEDRQGLQVDYLKFLRSQKGEVILVGDMNTKGWRLCSEDSLLLLAFLTRIGARSIGYQRCLANNGEGKWYKHVLLRIVVHNKWYIIDFLNRPGSLIDPDSDFCRNNYARQ